MKRGRKADGSEVEREGERGREGDKGGGEMKRGHGGSVIKSSESGAS